MLLFTSIVSLCAAYFFCLLPPVFYFVSSQLFWRGLFSLSSIYCRFSGGIVLTKPLPFYASLITSDLRLPYLSRIHDSLCVTNAVATYFHDGDPGCTASNWNGCDPSGGCNASNPASFNPTNLNISNWIESMKVMGMTHAGKYLKGLLLLVPIKHIYPFF